MVVRTLDALSGPYKCNTTAIQEKILVLQLYCSCIALVLTALSSVCVRPLGNPKIFFIIFGYALTLTFELLTPKQISSSVCVPRCTRDKR